MPLKFSTWFSTGVEIFLTISTCFQHISFFSMAFNVVNININTGERIQGDQTQATSGTLVSAEFY